MRTTTIFAVWNLEADPNRMSAITPHPDLYHIVTILADCCRGSTVVIAYPGWNFGGFSAPPCISQDSFYLYIHSDLVLVPSSLHVKVKNATYCWVVDSVRLFDTNRGCFRCHVETGSEDHWTFDTGCGGSLFRVIKWPVVCKLQGFLRYTLIKPSWRCGLPQRRYQSSLPTTFRFCVSIYCSCYSVVNFRACLMIWKEFWTTTFCLGNFGPKSWKWTVRLLSGCLVSSAVLWVKTEKYSFCFCLDGNGSCSWHSAVLSPQFKIQYNCSTVK